MRRRRKRIAGQIRQLVVKQNYLASRFQGGLQLSDSVDLDLLLAVEAKLRQSKTIGNDSEGHNDKRKCFQPTGAAITAERSGQANEQKRIKRQVAFHVAALPEQRKSHYWYCAHCEPQQQLTALRLQQRDQHADQE